MLVTRRHDKHVSCCCHTHTTRQGHVLCSVLDCWPQRYCLLLLSVGVRRHIMHSAILMVTDYGWIRPFIRLQLNICVGLNLLVYDCVRHTRIDCWQLIAFI